MLNKSKIIIFTLALFKTLSLVSTQDYLDKSLPKKSYVYAPHREAYLAKKFSSNSTQNQTQINDSSTPADSSPQQIQKKIEQTENTLPSKVDKKKDCFFCNVQNEETVKERALIKSFEFNNVVLNEYPYSRGHILITPKKHVASLTDLNEKERSELLHIIDISLKILEKILHTDGFNIGINIGKCGGASIPDHLHVHIVPRFFKEGLNRGFMRTASKTTVISWDMDKLLASLREHFNTADLS